MGEQHDNSEHREQTSKHLREQDMEWEQHRRRELGNSAIMGPRYSPTKRQMEPLDGALKEKRRRRKLKHELIKDGWGELQDHHGADVRIETTNIPQLLIDGEQGVVDWEQLSPPIGEAQDHPDQPMGSLIPREHKIPTFWNPTAT